MKMHELIAKNGEVIKQILKNSRRIDEMREEVERLVPLLLSLVPEDQIIPLMGKEVILTTDTCTWKIEGFSLKAFLSAECRLNSFEFIAYNTSLTFRFNPKCVQGVYESLPVFYELLISTFHLDVILQPFLHK